ncbi:MAG: hypothetical protein UX17_C0020G0005 [Parcubacteria group bacterium GW2011_GWC2_45_7]|nr:MAG: hypothetical protein UX17_C0020G0005 [Parcubacteria group bacterium GW2011_GWC2_45_7]KKU73186.1 MAG: hypothetical protein UX98_C0010G0028 [Parcubacteria group bacterium GW2011_GWA2_47_26]
MSKSRRTEQDPAINPPGSVSEHQPPRELLRAIAETYPEFRRLAEKWTREDIEVYLRRLFNNEGAVELIRSGSVEGLLTEFHERAKIEELEALTDKEFGTPGHIKSQIKSGGISWHDVPFIKDKQEIAQTLAHNAAMKAEFSFVKYLAGKCGYSGDEYALALTHPRFLAETARKGAIYRTHGNWLPIILQ